MIGPALRQLLTALKQTEVPAITPNERAVVDLVISAKPTQPPRQRWRVKGALASRHFVSPVMVTLLLQETTRVAEFVILNQSGRSDHGLAGFT